jgi:2'-5' RNA ligase
MEEQLGTYYLGATVADVKILETVRHANIRTRIALGIYRGEMETRMQECHITLVPPFHTTYREATSINMACARALFFENHPLVATRFSLGKMSDMVFGDSTIFYFNVDILGGEGCRLLFLEYVTAMRKRLALCERFSFRENIPEKFLPHITILTIQKRKGESSAERVLPNTRTKEVVEEYSLTKTCLPFLVTYPTLYAKYANGWEPLSHDPCVAGW